VTRFGTVPNSLTALASIAALALVGSGCGSASTPRTGASPPSTVAHKLSLARPGGGTADRAAMPAIYPVRPTSYVLDGTLADLGTSAAVRRMVPHALTEADVRRLAEALGMSATPTATATGYEVTDKDATLTFTTSNGVVQVSYALGAPGAVGGSPGSSGSGGASTGTAIASPPDGVVSPAPPPPATDVPPVEPAPVATKPAVVPPVVTPPVVVPPVTVDTTGIRAR